MYADHESNHDFARGGLSTRRVRTLVLRLNFFARIFTLCALLLSESAPKEATLLSKNGQIDAIGSALGGRLPNSPDM